MTEELLLVEDKPMNTYKERDELASAVRENTNQRAGKDDWIRHWGLLLVQWSVPHSQGQ